MTPKQCRQARELLGWHQQRLALQANSCLSSVVGFETEEKLTCPATVNAFRAVLETAGVEFFEASDDGVGARRQKIEQ